ncbi:MAG: hypothetical protein K6G65_02485 [Lachnospiraceae bacterium]|nr:hypothetical protein [Lachnospiraceae bacterium]
MSEKIFHTMNRVGVANLVLGILTIIMSTVLGITMIISGVRLIQRKKDLLF